MFCSYKSSVTDPINKICFIWVYQAGGFFRSHMSILFQQTSEEVDGIDSGEFLAFKTSNIGGQWLFLSMLVSSTNFRRSSLRYATALSMKYSFVVTAITEFALLTDLLITTSGKLSCIVWRKSSLQNFTTFSDWLTSKCWG